MAVATKDALTSSKSTNPSSFSGAVDIIIIKHNDTTFKSTPFHVRFGKYLAEFPFNVNVSITINDEQINNLCMTLNENGIAHFDGNQPNPQIKQKQQQEEKASTINDNTKIKTTPNDTDETITQNTKNKGRKRDKLKGFVNSSLSYWNGSSEAQTENKNNNESNESKQSNTTDNIKHKKRHFAKNYMNKLASKWMVEDNIIDINNIPTNQQIQLFISKLKYGKNKIIFTIKTPSKMDKFKKRIYKKSKTKPIKSENTQQNVENSDSDNDVIDNTIQTDMGNDIKLKERYINGNIYLWNCADKIIISDVDGTITKSDIGGHVLPRIGFDYVQNGICNILNRLNSSGYKIMYLTARGIGQSNTTRNYLFNELCVPNGAVICSSSTTRAALYREAIQKRPQDFKIPTLNMIVNAFDGSNNKPFVGGFGNRDTDAKTYKYFGIDKSKIFIIGLNKKQKDKIKLENDQVIATYINDYNEIFENINDIFEKLDIDQD